MTTEELDRKISEYLEPSSTLEAFDETDGRGMISRKAVWVSDYGTIPDNYLEIEIDPRALHQFLEWKPIKWNTPEGMVRLMREGSIVVGPAVVGPAVVGPAAITGLWSAVSVAVDVAVDDLARDYFVSAATPEEAVRQAFTRKAGI